VVTRYNDGLVTVDLQHHTNNVDQYGTIVSVFIDSVLCCNRHRQCSCDHFHNNNHNNEAVSCGRSNEHAASNLISDWYFSSYSQFSC